MTVLAATSLPEQVAHALAAEFALPDAGTTTVVVARLLTAIVLGGVLGLEREAKGRAAGLRTHILVCVGSALFVMAPLLAGVSMADVTRVMQGIVSGIGFLGAGAIPGSLAGGGDHLPVAGLQAPVAASQTVGFAGQ